MKRIVAAGIGVVLASAIAAAQVEEEPPPSAIEPSALEERILREGSASESSLEQDVARADTRIDARAIAEGKDLYKKGDYALALDRFQVAHGSDPANAEASLLLGLTYLRLEDPARAAIHWSDFVKGAEDRKLAGDVGKYVTILLHEANHQAARSALERERQLTEIPTNPSTVAVGPFRNLGSAEYAPLGKALAAMLIDNLQGIPDVQVLEREQVQALVDEANLAASGLVEESTAVRAGKLLRAGTVAAGSHIDFTASPTQLKVEAVLVEVDDAKQLATATEEKPVEQFYDVVPEIAKRFTPVLTGREAAQLPAPQAARVTEDHTKSLPAALAFGRALDAKDRKDSDEALRNCREAEGHDPDFQLAKRVCGLIPPVWMSPQAVAAAVEASVIAAPAGLAAGYTPWIVGGLVVAGAAAGGAVAATSGDGDGGGGGGDNPPITNAPGGNNPPGLQGVPSNVNSPAGRTVSFSVSANDPDGGRVTLTAPQLPPGATFTQTSGALSNGTFRWSIRCDQVGTFASTICAQDDANPPAQQCQDTQYRISECPPEPTPIPEPTPVPCDPIGASCNPNNPSECCSGECGETPNNGGDTDNCCIPVRGSCSGAGGNCCGVGADCQGGRCCLEFGPCSGNADCCSNDCYFGNCTAP